MELSTKIRCPNCKKEFEVKVREMIPGRKSACPHCKSSIRFTGDDGRKVQGALDDLEKTLKKGFDIRL